MERIHYHCHCLQRDFTFEQWSEYLKQHPDSTSESVAEWHGFRWTVHDICENPHAIEFVNDPKNTYPQLSVTTAQLPDNQWVYGLSHYGLCKDYSYGGGFGVRFNSGDKFPTENAAIIAALEHVKKQDLLSKYDKIVTEAIFSRKVTQLSLF